MSTIVPRWEFRTFGEQFGAAEVAFAAAPPRGEIQESDEVYLLSQDGEGPTETVKIRDDLVDVKSLREVSADGLERWEPTMKEPFPLRQHDMERVTDALRLPRPAARDTYTLDQFLDQVVGLTGAVRAVDVQKRRVRYTIGGCTAELTHITADGRATRTIAIESEDPAAVAAVIRDVGLEGHLNTNYPRGLASLLDQLPTCYAVIDVGTNSVKFHLAERLVGDAWRTVVDRAEVTRLGEGLEEGGRIAPQALERTIVAMRAMVDEARHRGALAIAAVGTAGLRAASDRETVLDAIRARTGLRVDVISGEEEGRLAYLATVAGLGLTGDRVVVFDTGGGSTQFTFGGRDGSDERFSVPVGAVRYTERFGLVGVVSPAVLADADATIAADLAAIDGRPVPDALVAMGGAVTNIAAVKHGLAVYDPAIVHGTVLDASEIDRQIELYRSLDSADRRAIVGLQPARAEVILAGACIVGAVMRKLGQTSLTVSERGLRHRLLAERFGR